jgi:hypothetical protein
MKQATIVAISPEDQPDAWLVVAPLLIAAAGVAVYANSLSAPWVFDGQAMISTNQTIRALWPPDRFIRGTNRPLAFFTFAANYAIGAREVWGYHVVNLSIHIGAALALFGVVRRTLCRGRLAARYGRSAGGLALAVAILWLVHPLQTQSVTYVYQRFESLMGLFFLLGLYAFIRALDASRPVRWYAVSLAFWLLALGMKEVAVVLPVILLWYDRALAAASWRELFERRWQFYNILAGILTVVGLLGFSRTAVYRGGGVLWAHGVTSLEYARSQPGVILHYARLCFWPSGQCLDYAWPVARSAAEIVPPLAAIAVVLTVATWSIFRHPALGFLFGWFFVILLPTSSFAPLRDLAFEHRMYLPLAAVVAAVVLGGYRALQWLEARGGISGEFRRVAEFGAVSACVLVLGTATYLRNSVYATEVSVWADTVAKAPHNARAHVHLANALRAERGNLAEHHYRLAVELNPSCSEAHTNLGGLLARRQPEQSVSHLRKALELAPRNADAHNNLANALARLGRLEEAIDHYRETLRLKPSHPQARANIEVVAAMQRNGRPGPQPYGPFEKDGSTSPARYPNVAEK